MPNIVRTSAHPFRLMRELLSQDPFRDLEGAYAQRGWNPSFDVKETAHAFVISADVPGLDEKDLDIQIAGNRLTISGHRQMEEKKEDVAWVSVERAYGQFSRAWTLPTTVDGDKITADLRHGILTLELPKRPEVQPRKVAVQPRTVLPKEKGEA